MFIQTEATPNPATLKFLPGRSVMPAGTFEARSAAEAERSPLAERLFAVPGVTGVFFGSDFVTVTKGDGEWQHLKPAILGAIMQHFMSGAPVLQDQATAGAEEGEEFFDEDDAGTVATIKELLDKHSSNKTEVEKGASLTTLKAGGKLLIYAVKLEHH